MASILKSLRLVADPNRLRLLLLLEQEELSVAELQEILAKGQSQISTHLAQLKQAGLVDDRRTGKNTFYRSLNDAGRQLMRSADADAAAARKFPKRTQDRQALRLVLASARTRCAATSTNWPASSAANMSPAVPGKGSPRRFLKLMPPMVIADLGAGEGTFSQLMAQRAKRVIAVDNSEKMVEFGADLARKARHWQSRISAWEIWRTCRSDSRHGRSRVSQPGSAPCAPSRARRRAKHGAFSSPAAASRFSI